MWMMGYNDSTGGGGDLNFPDSFNGRKLRPLIPRPTTSSSISSTNTTNINVPCLTHIHSTDLLSLNHHFEQSKRESINTQQQHQQQVVVSSSRWNPTPEQLQTLEELYRRGTRTPSAEQIQHITAQLRRYGKIEGKNVFYWFQNHKARERQKRRRQLESVSDEHCRDMETIERKESGAHRTGGFEVEQTKSWGFPTNCCTLAEKTASIHRAAAKAAASECRTDGWLQFHEGELQQRRSLIERNATWQMMQLSYSPPTHLINPTTTASITTTTTASETARTIDPKLLKNSQDLNIFISPYYEDLNRISNDENAGFEESQTLQLFPLRNCNDNENITEKENESSGSYSMDANFTPSQFFEFLPLKN